MKYLYLHGLGQTSDSWNNVIKETRVAGDSISLSLNDMLTDKCATYDELYSALIKECDKYDDVVLCGLSLGAVLALNYALDFPDKIKSLVLIAPQYKMPKFLLKLQNIMFKFMPASNFDSIGFKKEDFISLCASMAKLDFSHSLDNISCPVLVVCGEKDNVNKKASKELVNHLKDANYLELLNTGHEANVESYNELALNLNKFYQKNIDQLNTFLIS